MSHPTRGPAPAGIGGKANVARHRHVTRIYCERVTEVAA
jgi:hypothetical protein